MDFITTSHRNAELLLNDTKYLDDFNSIKTIIKSINENELISKFNEIKKRRPSLKSLSVPINEILKIKFEKNGWSSESGIFREPPYNKKNVKRWRLDFAKNKISIEVGFNHGEAIAHNILKPILASNQNHIKKEIETEIGIVITATNKLKKNGNFDSAVGDYEKYVSYLLPYYNIITYIGKTLIKTLYSGNCCRWGSG